MTERIDSGVNFQQSLDQAGESTPHSTEGQYRGQKVAKLDIQSLIADAAEEMTFSVSEKIEKKLSKRKIGRAAGIKSRAMEQAEAYLKKLPDNLTKEKVQEFVEQLKQQGNVSPRDISRYARDFFQQQSHQFAGLLYARKMLTESGGSEQLLKSLQTALDDCMQELEPQLDSGLEVLTGSAGFSSSGRSEVQRLWEYYRNMVQRYEELSEINQSLSEKYSEDEFTEAICFLIKAIGQYLQSKDASIAPEELQHVINDLYHLELLGQMHLNATGILKKMHAQFNLTARISALDMLNRILVLKNEKWLKSDQVIEIISQVGIDDIEAKIYILRELKEFVRLIPLKAYQDPDIRSKLIDAFQEALDLTIDREEEMLE